MLGLPQFIFRMSGVVSEMFYYFTQSLQTEGDCTCNWAAVTTFHTLPNSLFIKRDSIRRCIEQLKALSVRGFVIASRLLVRTSFCL